MAVIRGNVGDNDLVGTQSADSIVGHGGDDTLWGRKGADTLNGGSDDDLLYGGKGGDTFEFKLGDGNDTIVDYEEEDRLKFISGTPDFYTKGNDVIVTMGKGSQKGTIVIKNVVSNGKVDKVITWLDSDDDEHIYPEMLHFNENRTGATILSAYNDDTFDINTYGSNYSGVVTIDGSAVTHDIEITGNKKANKIIGGEGADTLYGGKGSDTLWGGDGNDVFAYANGDGKNVIVDYEMGDVIKLTSGRVSDISASLNAKTGDYTFAIGNGSITVKNAKSKYIQVVDAYNAVAWFPENPVEDDAVYNNGTVTLRKKYKGDEFNVAALENDEFGNNVFPGRVYVIDASAVTHKLSITANKDSNTIIGTKQNDTIDGGAGADTITGGKGNDVLIGGDDADVFVYNKGDGNDKILDYDEEDLVSISGTSVSSTVASGSDVILKLKDKSKITVVNGVGKNITYVDDTNPTPDTDPVEFSQGGKSVTLLSGYSDDSFNVADYTNGSKVVTIDASAVESSLEITANKKANVIFGTDQKDVIYAGAGADTIYGNKGNDVLYGGAGADVFVYNKGDGSDTIADYDKSDTIVINGVEVKTVTTAKNDSDVILTLADKKKITVAGGADKAISLTVNGVDTLIGDPDDLDGVVYNEDHTAVTLKAGYSKDSFTSSDYGAYENTLATIKASAVKKDLILGGNGLKNYIYGGSGDDTMDGGAGNDYLTGHNGNDSIFGGKGNDSLYGGKGVDTLWGGVGNDTLTGNEGNDVFIYNGDGDDVITDYVWAKDRIVCQSGRPTNVSTEGNDVVFRMSNGNTLTLVNAADKPAVMMDSSGNPVKMWEGK